MASFVPPPGGDFGNGRRLPLRERKKQRLRAELTAVSQRLFHTQGYEATTLEQIAEEAEVSVPTLLAYFSSKERLALAGDWDVADALRAAVDDPRRTEDTLSIWRRFVIESAEWMVAHRRFYLRVGAMEASNAALARARTKIYLDYEETLTRGLAADAGSAGSPDLATRLLATMLAFGMAAVTRQWIARGGAGDLVNVQTAVVDFAADRFPRPRPGHRPHPETESES